MGVCTQGDIQIELQTVEDADYVYSQIEKIEELTKERTKSEITPHFDLQDNHVDGTVFNCNVYSSRIPNGEYQIDQVLTQVKLMVTEKKIKPPFGFTAELTVQHSSWHFNDEEFNDLIEEDE